MFGFEALSCAPKKTSWEGSTFPSRIGSGIASDPPLNNYRDFGNMVVLVVVVVVGLSVREASKRSEGAKVESRTDFMELLLAA